MNGIFPAPPQPCPQQQCQLVSVSRHNRDHELYQLQLLQRTLCMLSPDGGPTQVLSAPPRVSRKSVSSPDSRMRTKSVRKSFLLFIKILFKYIADDELMLEQCKLIVYKCRLEGRRTQCSYLHVNLMDSLQVELKQMVGESIWERTMMYYTHYRSRRILHQWGTLMEESLPTEIFIPTELSDFLSMPCSTNGNDPS
jgi:hypothetical protein